MKRSRKILIAFFIGLNLLTILIPYLPHQGKLIQTLHSSLNPYLSFFGLHQDWSSLALRPLRNDEYLAAMVEFKDGTTDSYEFEREDNMNPLKKYAYGERFRKISSESMLKNRFLWRDAVKFATRKVSLRHPQKVPLKVHLFRLWAETPEMGKDIPSHHFLKGNYKTQKLHTHEVI